MRETKRGRFSLKADAAGQFRCVFATLDVVDHDGDVTKAGAFAEGADVIVGSWGHKTAELPVGRAVMSANDREALAEGEFFLDTRPGEDTYKTVKALGDLCEWSYVYVPTKVSFGEFDGKQVRFLERVDVFSIDPVLKGAGIGTRTTGIKSDSAAPFLDHLEQIAEAVGEFAERAQERAAHRVKAGRSLSAANVAKLRDLAEALGKSRDALVQLVADDPSGVDASLVNQALAFQRERARLLGVQV